MKRGDLIGLVPFGAVLAGWAILPIAVDYPSYMLPPLPDVWTHFVEITRDGTLARHILASLQRLALGFAVGVGAAVPLGIAIALNRHVADVLKPLLTFLQSIAGIAWVPLAIIWFGIGIGSVVFVFALNLAGVFEFVLPGRASNAMESAGSTSGLAGSFFQGVFATLLATPCTAPFLGSALGFAFSQSAAVIVAMFAAVASGMALPYLILSASPGWLKFLPRPGAWMERLKQFMAFPLFATLVWVLSILGGQRGTDGVIWFCAFLLCLAFACWLFGSFCGPLAPGAKRTLALLLIVATVGFGGWYFLGKKFAHVGVVATDRIAWVPFSKAKIQEELAAGRSVFVDFTADWCITCKFNERTAIDTRYECTGCFSFLRYPANPFSSALFFNACKPFLAV